MLATVFFVLAIVLETVPGSAGDSPLSTCVDVLTITGGVSSPGFSIAPTETFCFNVSGDVRFSMAAVLDYGDPAVVDMSWYDQPPDFAEFVCRTLHVPLTHCWFNDTIHTRSGNAYLIAITCLGDVRGPWCHVWFDCEAIEPGVMETPCSSECKATPTPLPSPSFHPRPHPHHRRRPVRINSDDSF